MSNMNFLNGLYYSINRTELATNMGRNAAQGFFSDAYMIDPENSVSYRSSDEGKAVLATRSPETLGYSPAKATLLFQTAVQQEQAAGNYKGGTADNPVEIKLSCVYQDQGQIDDEGVTEKGYLENTFNAACKDLGVKLTIENSCGTVWSDVYYKYLMKGQCDLGFGSISGNTLDPLNFMDTLKSNNSSGFTLNWGADTSKVADTIVYDNHTWSYDALWAAGNSGTVCKDGENLDIFVNANGGEVDSVVDSLANTISGLSTSYTYYVDAKVSFVIDKVVWYNPNTKKEDISFDVSTVVTDDDNGTLTITFDLTNPSTETKSMGSQAIQGTTYDITYGYLSVYYSQTVAGVTTSGIESDIFFAFLVPQAATSSTTSAAGFVAPATGVSIARA